jgi:hypothetical protein
MRRIAALALSLVCFSGSGALLALHAQAADQPGSAFYGYTLVGQASGVEVVEDRPTANSHPEGDAEVPLSRVTLTSGPVGYALGSVAWPSALAANAGDLLVFAGNGNVPEELGPPLNEPVRAETRTGGPQTVTNDDYPGTSMRAMVKPGDVAADAVIHGGQVGSASGLGSTETHSKAALGSASVSSSAQSSTKDVSLAGGVVTIKSVVSRAQALSDGTTASASGTTTVSDLAVAGVPVTVDADGVHVAGNGTPVDTAQVNSALANLGMTIVLSAPTQTKDGATISYDSGSLIVYWNPSPDESLTYRIGGARVTAGAFLADPAGAPAGGSVPPVTTPAGGSVQPPAVPGGGVLPGGGSPATGTGTTGQPPAVAQPQPTTGEPLQLVGRDAEAGAYVLAALGALLLLGALLRFPALVLVPPAAATCTRRPS